MKVSIDVDIEKVQILQVGDGYILEEVKVMTSDKLYQYPYPPRELPSILIKSIHDLNSWVYQMTQRGVILGTLTGKVKTILVQTLMHAGISLRENKYMKVVYTVLGICVIVAPASFVALK